MRNHTTISRRSLFRLGGSAACVLGLDLLAGGIGPFAPTIAFADEVPIAINEASEYTFTPEECLTSDGLPSEGRLRSFSSTSVVVNLGGSDRFETVAKEALYAFPTSSTAVVASGMGFADSIAAAGLAGALDCPILLTAATYVPSATVNALNQMGVSNIVLLGSESVANDEVMGVLKGYGSVERVSGPDRYATQMAVFEYGFSHGLWQGDTAIVASAMDFPDALSASPISYALKAPVFFCDETLGLPAAQRETLASRLNAANFLLLGSTAVTSASVESYLRGLSAQRGGVTVRLGGSDRYETSEAIAEYAVNNLGFTWDGVAFASGRGPYDALGGGVVQGKEKSVLLLADEVDSSSVDVIIRNGGTINTGLKYFGSTVVVPAEVRSTICSKLGVIYYENTSFIRYNITLSRMAELQVARNEGYGYGFDDYYAALNPDAYEYGTSAFNVFAVLTNGYSGVSAADIDNYVAANCIYQEENYGRASILRDLGFAFVNAAQQYGVNEVYLLAHAIWESGWGCSQLAAGWTPEEDGEVIVNGVSYPYVTTRTYYNLYGIGAVDANALAGGKALAVKEGWTSPEKAVLGAAKWISSNYLRRSIPQNTLYLMKYDVGGAAQNGSAWHEYCTGLSDWCKGIGSLIRGCYSSAGYSASDMLEFNVPVYSGA